MYILKGLIVYLMMSVVVKAQSPVETEAETVYDDQDMNLMMCRSLGHRFEGKSHECIYCAHGLHYKANSLDCTGTPDALGKCVGKDHYHAKTQECMYCAEGYSFNEDLKECMLEEEPAKKK